jgi:hypothetical protein
MEDSDDVRGWVGEEARLGRSMWGGRLPVVWGVKLIDKKKLRDGQTLGLRWPPFNVGTQQPTKSCRQQ